MRRLGFREFKPVAKLNLGEKQRNIIHFAPPPELADQLDEALLILDVRDRLVKGEFNLKLHESALLNRLKSLVAVRYLTCSLEIDGRELITPDGFTIFPDSVLPRLRSILAEALVLPDNEKNRLLRSSDAPDEETLLRPAAGTTCIRPEELLRPSVGDAPRDPDNLRGRPRPDNQTGD